MEEIDAQEDGDAMEDVELGLPQESISMSAQSTDALVPGTNDDRTTTISAQAPSNAEPETTATAQYEESNNPLPDYISFFRAKLKDHRQNCILKCCSLWIAVHFAIFAIFLILIAATIDIVYDFIDGVEITVLVYFIIIYIVIEWIICIMAGIGLYKCKTKWILAQYICCFLNLLLPGYRVIVAVTSDNLVTLEIVGFCIDIIFIAYCILVFQRVYLWSKYFINGGKYNVNMLKPEMKTNCIGLF